MNIAIVGATGLVGRTLINVIEEDKMKIDNLVLFASKKSVKKKILFHGEKLPVKTIKDDKDLSGFDYIFFTADSSISEKYAKNAADNGAIVIDNSSFYRLADKIPLIVPEVNGNLLKGYKGIIANPNCSTIQMILSINKIYLDYGIQEIVVSTYQAVSGYGTEGVEELEEQKNGSNEFKVFPNLIFDNVIPQIGEIKDGRYSEEEYKMVFETKKIFNDPMLRVFPTAVRVPVTNCHAESIYLRTIKPYFEIDNIKSILSNSENVILSEEVITPKDVNGKNETYISRLRGIGRKGIMMWVVADNLRVGAATNAFRILKKHIELN